MFWGKLGQRGQGTSLSSTVEGESQQHRLIVTALYLHHHTSQLQQTLHRLQSHHLIHLLTITALYLHHHNNLTTVATNIPSVVTNSNTHYIGRYT